ncbi:LacI family DNA-binding transcriptional regulator [Oceanobacillus polygoni]|uniref:LacI family transcriptional regulator n=1 Tax=Oceanobacillus polygoni TaxID=1235259 RepID=A0A9X0YNC0_9BACI|nr:LacI family DNA-binding transcriptional regulator [Oceanobacillus polygoni]MBP2075827.1 LacI family transcriptional regulator [Oceanobacillus polygoni]
MNVTIKDIANVAGVSYSTVSKALNNSPLVKENTKRKIIKISQEMGYKPNFAARSLVSNQTKIIGLIWPTIERIVLSTLVTEISNQINKTSYSMILSVDPVQTSLETFRRFQVDGIILFEENNDEFDASQSSALLSYGVTRKDDRNYPKIDPNHEQAMHMAVEYLAMLGHTQIAYIGDLSSIDPMQIQKYKGFKKAIKQHGLFLNEDYLIDTEGLDWYNGYTATGKLFKMTNRPTAIVGGSYDISGGIIRAMKERKLHIPNDFSIISYDNVPQMANMEFPLTSIGVPVGELAAEIVKSIIKLVESEEMNSIDVYSNKMMPKLNLRSSCARPRL